MNRRSFLAALSLAPVAAKAAPTTTHGLEHYIRANVWATPPQPTEAEFIRYLEWALAQPPRKKYMRRG